MIPLRQSAIVALHAQQHETASETLSTCLEQEPNDTESAWYLGLALLLQTQVSAAQMVWMAALYQEDAACVEQQTESLLAVLTTEANYWLQQEQFASAAAIFEQILELNPDDLIAQFNLGNVALRQGELDEAIAQFQAVLALDPGFLAAHYSLGWLFESQGNFRLAYRHYSQVVMQDPIHLEAQYRLGLCLIELHEWDAAIAQFQQLVQLNPAAIQAYLKWGELLLQQGDLTGASDRFSQAFKLQPEFAQAYLQHHSPSTRFGAQIHTIFTALAASCS